MDGPDRDLTDDRLLRTVRVVSAIVILLLLVFLVVIDTLGKVFISPAFGVSDVIFASLLGALLTLIGISAIGQIRQWGR